MNPIRNVTGIDSRHAARRAAPVVAGLLACAAALGCGTEEDARPFAERVALLERDLTLGSQGPDVETLHAYLTRHGYFPDAALAQRFPAWRSVVATPPAVSWIYDERTREAVVQLQHLGGLPSTGVVDAATRALVQSARCGVPDGNAPDESEKFATTGKWNKTAITYKVTNTDDVSLSVAQQETAAAFAAWSAQTNLTFSPATGSQTPDIIITFKAILDINRNIDGPGGWLGLAGGPGTGTTIDVDSAETWSNFVRTPAGQWDLQTLLIHEIGHTLGLAHSAFESPKASMFPFLNVNDRSLESDDKVAVSSLYDAYATMPGGARDIAAGADGSLWKVGTNGVSGGFGIHKWNGSGWTSAGGAGVRIAVAPNGIPWTVRSDDRIFRRTSSSATSGTWEEVPNARARDIGIGADGSVWIVGINSPDGGVNFQLWKLNPSTTFWDPADALATRVAVGPTGNPWLINSHGQVWRKTTNNPFSGAWDFLGGDFDDIGISDGNYAWVVKDDAEGFVALSAWNEQSSFTGIDKNGNPYEASPSRSEWKLTVFFVNGSSSGSGASIAVGPGGKPHVAHYNGGATFRPTK